MARYFIDRPIFAWVIAIVIMLAGALSILKLPVSQYPEIAPPAISITTKYPGASAQTIENSVTQISQNSIRLLKKCCALCGLSLKITRVICRLASLSEWLSPSV